MITTVDLRLTGLLLVLNLLYFIHVNSNIFYYLLQNLLYFLSENTNISYFLEFLKSYILVEVDSEHCGPPKSGISYFQIAKSWDW